MINSVMQTAQGECDLMLEASLGTAQPSTASMVSRPRQMCGGTWGKEETTMLYPQFSV